MGQNWDNMTQFLNHFDSEKILSACKETFREIFDIFYY